MRIEDALTIDIDEIKARLNHDFGFTDIESGSFLDKFKIMYHETTLVLHAAIDNSDFENLAIETHRLKGVCYNLRMKPLGDMVMELEKAALDHDLNACRSCYGMLEELQFR